MHTVRQVHFDSWTTRYAAVLALACCTWACATPSTSSTALDVGVDPGVADAVAGGADADGSTGEVQDAGPLPQPQPAACPDAPVPVPKTCDPPHDPSPSAAVCVDGWCWREPLPHGQGYGQPWASSPSSVWLPGRYGKVFHFDGATLQAVDVPTRGDVAELAGTGPCDVWGRFTKGTALIHWQGKAWETVPLPKNFWVSQLGVATDGTVMVLRYDGTLWKRQGSEWVLATKPSPLLEAQAFWASSPADVWLAGVADAAKTHSVVARYDGNQWQTLPKPPQNYVNMLWGSGVADVWLAGMAGSQTTVARWTGSGWTSHALAEYQNPLSISGTCSSDLWLTSKWSLHHFDGAAWQTALTWASANGQPNCAPRFASTAKGMAFGGGDQGTLYTSDASGWQANHACLPGDLQTTATAAADGVVFLGHNGSVRRTDGKVWQSAPVASGWVRGLVAWSASDALALGQTETGWSAFRFNGSSWVAQDPAPMPDLPKPTKIGDSKFVVSAAVPLGPGQALVIGGKTVYDDSNWSGGPYPRPPGKWQTVLHRYDNGKWTFELVPGQMPASMWAANANDIWVVSGGSATIWHYDGKGWQSSDVFSSIVAPWTVRGTGPSDVWLAGTATFIDNIPGAIQDKVLAHWDGAKWTTVKADPKMVSATLRSMVFDGQGLLVAGQGWMDGIGLTCWRYAGGKWSDGGCPVSGELVQAGSSGKIWLAGMHALLERVGDVSP